MRAIRSQIRIKLLIMSCLNLIFDKNKNLVVFRDI